MRRCARCGRSVRRRRCTNSLASVPTTVAGARRGSRAEAAVLWRPAGGRGGMPPAAAVLAAVGWTASASAMTPTQRERQPVPMPACCHLLHPTTLAHALAVVGVSTRKGRGCPQTDGVGQMGRQRRRTAARRARVMNRPTRPLPADFRRNPNKALAELSAPPPPPLAAIDKLGPASWRRRCHCQKPTRRIVPHGCV